MGKENCIYVDKKGKWWTAEAEIFGDGEIHLVEEKTAELTKDFKEDLIGYAKAVAPYILYEDENGNWDGIEAGNRPTIQK